MGNNIKGITIEIGGSTQKLDQALKGNEKAAKSLQEQLKAVNAALKLDPTNVEAARKKQELLTKSIENAKEKLDTLKEAQEAAAEAFDKGKMSAEQYRAIETEIINTENELKRLEDELKNVNGAADAVGAKFEEIGGKVSGIGDKISAVGDKISGAGEKLLPVTAAITAVGGASVGAAMEFEDAIAKLSTIADTSEETGVPLQKLQDQITELSDQTGISASEIANNVYDAISAGQKTGDAVNFVSKATALAKAGFTDSGAALDILTTSLNAYGLEADQVGHVSDVLITTQNLGKTTVDQLAASMGKVIPTAKANGVSIENLAGMYAVMTSNGIATAESTTYMNSMLNELGKQGTTAAKAFAEGTEHIKEGGLTMAEAMEQGWSLTDVLSILDEQAYASGTSIANMFGSAEAGKAANVLWGNAKKLDDAVEQMGDSVGATDEAFAKLDTTSNQAKIALNEIKNAGIDLGKTILQMVMPYFQQFTQKIKDATTWFKNLDNSQKQLIVKIGALVAALAPALIIGGKLILGIGKITSGVGGLITKVGGVISKLGGLKGAIAAVASPVGIVVAAIGALVAAFVYLYNTNDEFREKVNNAVEKIKASFSSMVEKVKPLIEKFKAAFENLMVALQPVFQFIIDRVMAVVNGIMNAIPSIISAITNAVDYVTNIVNAVIALLHGDFDGFLSYIRAAVQNKVDFIKNILNALGAFLSSYFSGIWETIVGIFQGVGQWFSDRFNEAYTGICNIFSAIGQWFGARWTDIKNVFSNVASFFQEKFNAAAAAIRNAFSSIPQFFSDLWRKITSIFVNAGQKVADGVMGAFKSACNAVFGTIEHIVNGFVDAINSIIGTINGIPGVSIGKLSGVSLPRLAKGGVLSRGQAIVGEAGAELLTVAGGRAIVTPLSDKNRNDTLSAAGAKTGGNFVQNINIHSPKPLTPYEVGRQTRNQTQNMILKLREARA